MSKQWVRCNRGIRLLTDDLRQMKRELRTLQWSLVEVILLMIFLSLDEPNEEITEQWHDDLHEWYICRDDQCPVESTGISRDVSQKRGYHRFWSCVKRRFVSTSTNSQISTQHECDSHSAAGDVGVVFSQKPSVVAWFQGSLCVPHLFGLPAPRKVDSSNGTHLPAISGIAANGSSVVGKICNDDKDDVSVCADGGSNVLSGPCCACGAQACATSSSFVDTFHVDSWNSRDNVEQRVQRRVRRNSVDLVQLGGQVTNPEDRDTAVKLRGHKKHVMYNRLATVSDRARWRAKLEESCRPIALALVVQNKRMSQTWLGTSIVVVGECF